ncbi:MAG: hypothetical protein H8D62_00890, partial [Bacteroidetes bacterium]|nr:hypothetical protein [Bacteroidota bacterium]
TIAAWDWTITDDNGVLIFQDDVQNPIFNLNDEGEYIICLTITTEGLLDSLIVDTIIGTCISCQTYLYDGSTLSLESGGGNTSSWDCVGGSCIELLNNSGEYIEYGDCLDFCGTTDSTSYNCVAGACVEEMDGSGVYSTYDECFWNCEDDGISTQDCMAEFTGTYSLTDVELTINLLSEAELLGGQISDFSWEVSELYFGDLIAEGTGASFNVDFQYGDYLICLEVSGEYTDSTLEGSTVVCSVCDTLFFSENELYASFFSGPTAIFEYKEAGFDGRIFDIQGREWKCDYADLPKGVYIINRKKVLKFE